MSEKQMAEYIVNGKSYRAWSRMGCSIDHKHSPHVWSSDATCYGPYFCDGMPPSLYRPASDMEHVSDRVEGEEWKLEVVGGGPIADTGDYDDGHWEISKGNISLVCESTLRDLDEYEVELRSIVKILNENGIDLVPDTSNEYVLYSEKQQLTAQLTATRTALEELVEAVKSTVVGDTKQVRSALAKADAALKQAEDVIGKTAP